MSKQTTIRDLINQLQKYPEETCVVIGGCLSEGGYFDVDSIIVNRRYH